MFGPLAQLLLGPVLDRVFAVIRTHQDNKLNRDVLEAELRQALLAALADVNRAQARAIIAEAGGESWLQRNWRPIVALSFAFVVAFYALILPIAVDWFAAPPVRVGDALLKWVMEAVTICLGGYIASRGLEKIARGWKG